MASDRTRDHNPDDATAVDYNTLVSAVAETLDLRGGLAAALDAADYTALVTDIGPVLDIPAGLHAAINVPQSESVVVESILAVDIERLRNPQHEDVPGVRVIEAFYRLLREAFTASSLPWEQCQTEDRGDGAIIFIPSALSTGFRLLDPLLGWLSTALDRHNQNASLDERFRLRLALHHGEVLTTEHGHTGTNVVLTCRLLDAAPLRTAAAHSATNLAVIVSEDIYYNVVRLAYRNIDPAAYHPITIKVKRTSARAWIHVPGSAEPPVLEPENHSGKEGDPKPASDSTDSIDMAAEPNSVTRWRFGR